MLCVWWDQRRMVCYELLKPGETVNTKRYQQQLTDLNRSLLEKRPERSRTERGNKKSFFFMTMLLHIWQYGLATCRNTQLGSPTPSSLLTKLDIFRLILVCIDGSRTCWAALWFVRRCEKMSRWMVRSKRGRFLLSWHSQITRKMGKMCNKRWSILWMKHFLSYFRFLTWFFRKKSAFRTKTPDDNVFKLNYSRLRYIFSFLIISWCNS